METLLQELSKSAPSPVLSVTVVILLLLLIWIIQQYLKKLNITLDKMGDDMGDLKAGIMELMGISKLHEHRLNGHDEDLKEIKDGRYVVKYRRGE